LSWKLGTYLVDRLEFDELPEFVLYERPWVSKSTSLGGKTKRTNITYAKYANVIVMLHVAISFNNTSIPCSSVHSSYGRALETVLW
jgi:hypothetical protein